MKPTQLTGARRFASLGLGLLLTSAASGQALAAGYQVVLNQTPLVAGAGNANCSYNFSSVGGTCHLTLNGIGTVSPVGGDGSATSASTTGFLQGMSTAGYFVDPSIHEKVSTAADLATASVHVHAEDTAINEGYAGVAQTSAEADLFDTLHYTIAGANASTITPITVSIAINGSIGLSGTAQDNNSFGEYSGSFIFGPATDQNSASFDFQFASTTGFKTLAFLGGSDPTGWTINPANTIATYSETYNLVGASGDLPVNVNSHINCGDGVICDYSAKIGIAGPGDFSYTSASGVFLTGGGVPEPATWAMMLVGFGGLGAAMRSRRRAAATAA